MKIKLKSEKKLSSTCSDEKIQIFNILAHSISNIDNNYDFPSLISKFKKKLTACLWSNKYKRIYIIILCCDILECHYTDEQIQRITTYSSYQQNVKFPFINMLRDDFFFFFSNYNIY